MTNGTNRWDCSELVDQCKKELKDFTEQWHRNCQALLLEKLSHISNRLSKLEEHGEKEPDRMIHVTAQNQKYSDKNRDSVLAETVRLKERIDSHKKEWKGEVDKMEANLIHTDARVNALETSVSNIHNSAATVKFAIYAVGGILGIIGSVIAIVGFFLLKGVTV